MAARNPIEVDELVKFNIAMIDNTFHELHNLFERLQNSFRLYDTTGMYYNEAMSLWYNNDNFGDGELLNALQDLLDAIVMLDGDNENVEYPIKTPFTTAFVSKQNNICLKYAYDIAKYFETYNMGLMPVSGDVVTEVPKFFCREILEQLPEFEFFTGPRKTSAINYVHDAIIKNQTVTNTKLTHYISNNSLVTLNEKIAETQRQIANSIVYLDNPKENKNILQETFRPQLNSTRKFKRVFNLIPNPSFTKKYIKLVNNDIEMILRSVNLLQYIDRENTLNNIIKLNRIKDVNEDNNTKK